MFYSWLYNHLGWNTFSRIFFSFVLFMVILYGLFMYAFPYVNDNYMNVEVTTDTNMTVEHETIND